MNFSSSNAMQKALLFPNRAIEKLFAEHLLKINREPTEQDFIDFGAEVEFEKYTDDNWKDIPLLNDRPISFIPHVVLIRARMMIQEVRDPEHYSPSYRQTDLINQTFTFKSSKYIENLEPMNSRMNVFDSDHIQMRYPCYCVPVPCETFWVRNLAHPSADHGNLLRLARSRSSDGSNFDFSETLLEAAPPRPKRLRIEDSNSLSNISLLSDPITAYHAPLDTPDQVAAVSLNRIDLLVQNNTSGHKRLVTPVAPLSHQNNDNLHDDTHRQARDLNYPVSNNFGIPALIKIYPPHEPLMNTIVECVGIYSEAPVNSLWQRDAADDSAFHDTFAPQAPRIHAILFRELGEANPLIPVDPEKKQHLKTAILNHLPHLRNSCLEWITTVLGGDALAAEYLFYYIISKSHVRVNSHEGIGHIPLNFIHCVLDHDNDDPKPDCLKQNSQDGYVDQIIMDDQKPLWTRSTRSRVEHILETLVTKRHTISLDPIHLSHKNFIPHKSEENDRLETGELQLPPGTHLVIDETQLQAGNIPAKHLQNLEALSNVIRHQFVNYEFNHYQLPFQVDTPTIILSEGASLFHIPCVVPLHSTQDFALPQPVSSDLLDQWRQMIGIMREEAGKIFEQSDQVMRRMEEDFVVAPNEFLTEELFSHWVAMARISSISFGEGELTIDRWNYIKELESTRLSRR